MCRFCCRRYRLNPTGFAPTTNTTSLLRWRNAPDFRSARPQIFSGFLQKACPERGREYVFNPATGFVIVTDPLTQRTATTRRPPPVIRLADELTRSGGKAIAITTDVTHCDQVKRSCPADT